MAVDARQGQSHDVEVAAFDALDEPGDDTEPHACLRYAPEEGEVEKSAGGRWRPDGGVPMPRTSMLAGRWDIEQTVAGHNVLMSRYPRRLIFGRPFDAVDDDDFNGIPG
jgi:hypothetical protein